MSEFKVGDRVRLDFSCNAYLTCAFSEWNGKIVTLSSIDVHVDNYAFMVKLNTDRNFLVTYNGHFYTHMPSQVLFLVSENTPVVTTDKSHRDHLIVDNEVLGKSFKFCRDCREEVL